MTNDNTARQEFNSRFLGLSPKEKADYISSLDIGYDEKRAMIATGDFSEERYVKRAFEMDRIWQWHIDQQNKLVDEIEKSISTLKSFYVGKDNMKDKVKDLLLTFKK